MPGKHLEEKSPGIRKWIRLRGASNDPESFDLAEWNGLAWEVPAMTSDGRPILLYIPDYMVAETLPESTDPERIYYPRKTDK